MREGRWLERGRRWLTRRATPTDRVESGPPADVVVALAFAADAGQQMLESSPSVSEVIGRLRGFTAAIGLPECEVDATLGSLTLSYWKPEMPAPVTVMRAVDVSSPQLARLSGTVEILGRVEHGLTDVATAAHELHQLKSAPGRRWTYRLLAVLASVTGWVIFLDGFSMMAVLVALLATLLTAPVRPLIERLTLPPLFGTAVIAVVVATVPNLAAAAGARLDVGTAVVGALFVYLPGVAVVSSVIDGLNNAPLSAVARGISAAVTAGALALGMLAGNTIGASLGHGADISLEYTPHATAAPILVSAIGAVIGMIGLAVAWDIPRPAIAPTLIMGAAGWLVVAVLAHRGSGTGWPVYVLAAAVIGAIGQVAAARQKSATSVYLGVAILPLVPGFTLYQAMLALAQGDPGVTTLLGRAALLSMAIAIGVAVGVALGRNLIRARALVPNLPRMSRSAPRRSKASDSTPME